MTRIWSDPVAAVDVDVVAFEEVALPVVVALPPAEVAFDMSEPVALPVALPLVDVPSPSILQPADAAPVSLADAVPVSLPAAAATSVSVMTFTETVGVPSVELSAEADCVWPFTSAVPTSQTIKPLNRPLTSAVDVLSFVPVVAVALSGDVVLPAVVVSSVAFCASSSNVVILLSSVCAYIEMPAKAVDMTATADKSDSNVNFVFRSLNTSIQTVCH